VGEEKFIGDFAYPFAWGLHIPVMCRGSLQKDRGWGDVFIEGCVCGNGRRGGGVVLVVVVGVDVYKR
jgi:hypothetical protein